MSSPLRILQLYVSRTPNSLNLLISSLSSNSSYFLDCNSYDIMKAKCLLIQDFLSQHCHFSDVILVSVTDVFRCSIASQNSSIYTLSNSFMSSLSSSQILSLYSLAFQVQGRDEVVVTLLKTLPFILGRFPIKFDCLSSFLPFLILHELYDVCSYILSIKFDFWTEILTFSDPFSFLKDFDFNNSDEIILRKMVLSWTLYNISDQNFIQIVNFWDKIFDSIDPVLFFQNFFSNFDIKFSSLFKTSEVANFLSKIFEKFLLEVQISQLFDLSYNLISINSEFFIQNFSKVLANSAVYDQYLDHIFQNFNQIFEKFRPIIHSKPKLFPILFSNSNQSNSIDVVILNHINDRIIKPNKISKKFNYDKKEKVLPSNDVTNQISELFFILDCILTYDSTILTSNFDLFELILILCFFVSKRSSPTCLHFGIKILTKYLTTVDNSRWKKLVKILRRMVKTGIRHQLIKFDCINFLITSVDKSNLTDQSNLIDELIGPLFLEVKNSLILSKNQSFLIDILTYFSNSKSEILMLNFNIPQSNLIVVEKFAEILLNQTSGFENLALKFCFLAFFNCLSPPITKNFNEIFGRIFHTDSLFIKGCLFILIGHWFSDRSRDLPFDAPSLFSKCQNLIQTFDLKNLDLLIPSIKLMTLLICLCRSEFSDQIFENNFELVNSFIKILVNINVEAEKSANICSQILNTFTFNVFDTTNFENLLLNFVK
ncbi:hypothetical protein RCL1_000637 [Eukaryota sp. TZLM3-RCL]